MNSDQDKNQLPTQKKLEDARLKGDIPRSPEINTTAVYLAFFLCLYISGGTILANVVLIFREVWSSHLATIIPPSDIMIQSTQSLLQELLPSIGFLLLSMPVAVLAINIVRRGIVFTPSNLLPKTNRISPLEGLKNKLGPNGWFEFLKGVTKALIFSGIVIITISPDLSEFPHLSQIDHHQVLAFFFSQISEIFLYVTVISSSLAILDCGWQHHRHIKKNMMSHQEVKDEFKDAEGDPHFKAIRRQRGFEMTSQQMAQAVKDADVVIVNPTHYAVALTWNVEKASAPIVSALGVDHIALRIRSIAEEHSIPIHIDIPTARALALNCNIGDEIQPEHYAAVAAAIRFSRRRLKMDRDGQ